MFKITVWLVLHSRVKPQFRTSKIEKINEQKAPTVLNQ